MKRMMSVVTMMVSLALSGCLTTSVPQAPKDPYSVDNPKAFQGKNKVAIGSFKISFVTFDKSSAKAGGSMASADSGYAKLTLRAKLDGVDNATFQSITDRAYRDLIQQLQANGYTVVDRKSIESVKSYRSLKTVPNPDVEEVRFKSITGGKRTESTFSPAGLPLYHKGEFGGAPLSIPFQIYSVASESGVPIINVHYLVHFAYFRGSVKNGDDKEARMSMGQAVQVQHGSVMGLAVGGRSTFSNPNGVVKLTWGEVNEVPYGTTAAATSGAQKAANAFSSAVGLLSGGSMVAKEFTITADPQKYSQAATDVIARVNKGFVGKMSRLK